MGSSRLAGKVLMELGGQPMLGLLLARLQRNPMLHVVVATSDLELDDPIAEFVASRHVDVVRGSERGVLSRFGVAVDRFPCDEVVRITADCPLSDPGIVSDVIAQRRARHADYCSNTLLRTYPDGLDVEVMTSEALHAAIAEATDPAEREHVTPYLYRHPERYRLAQHLGRDRLGDERWTVDTADDIDALRAVVNRLDDPISATWPEVLSVAGRHAVVPCPYAEADHDTPIEAGRRAWRIVDSGTEVGRAELQVVAGVGRLRLDPGGRGHLDAVKRSLAADAQVRELVVED